MHPQIEGRVALAVVGDKIEEVPLRHQRNELAARRDVTKIDQLYVVGADLGAELFNLLMRNFKKLVDQTELRYQFKRGGMHGVAAKVAEEVAVFLQNDDVDAGARQQISQHHPRRAAAGNAALGGDRGFAHGRSKLRG